MKYKEIQHGDVYYSNRMIPIGARPQIDPSLSNVERIPAEAPVIPTEYPSTGWIIEDVSSFGKSKTFDTEMISIKPYGLFFNSNGTSMYTYDSELSSILKFDMSTAYDISSGTFSMSFGLINSGSNIHFDSSGTYLFLCRNVSGSFYVYRMTTPWDLSTLVYHDRMSICSSPSTAIFVSENGHHLYLTTKENKVYHYRMSFPMDISTAEEVSVLDLSDEVTNEIGAFIVCPNGTKSYVLERESSKIRQFSMSTPYHVSSMESDDKVLSSNGIDESGMFIYDSSNIHTIGHSTRIVYNYTVLFDISKSTFVASKLGIPGDGMIECMRFNPDGSMMYTGGMYTNYVYQYELTIPWDIRTITTWKSRLSTPLAGYIKGLEMSPDGSKVFVTNARSFTYDPSGFIIQYTLNTPWEFGGGYSSEIRRAFPTGHYSPWDLCISPDGTRLYEFQNEAGYYGIFQYDITTPWDINSINFTPVASYPLTAFVNSGFVLPSGKYLYRATANDNRVIEYEFLTAWDLSTLVETGNVFLVPKYFTGMYINNQFDMYLSIEDDIYWYKLEA